MHVYPLAYHDRREASRERVPEATSGTSDLGYLVMDTGVCGCRWFWGRSVYKGHVSHAGLRLQPGTSDTTRLSLGVCNQLSLACRVTTDSALLFMGRCITHSFDVGSPCLQALRATVCAPVSQMQYMQFAVGYAWWTV